MTIQDYLQQAAAVIEATAQTEVNIQVDEAIELITTAFRTGKPLLICGNGGSASDASHIAGEFVGRFLKERPALKCMDLVSNAAIMTAWCNDYNFETVFARQVEAYGEEDGILLGISTSGNSPNVLAALAQAKKMKMKTIGLTGLGGGKMADACDVLIEASSRHTPEIQQVHLCLYHYICEQVEANLFP